MEVAYIVFRQTVVMFLYMFAGYVLYNTGKLTVKGSKDIANMLVWLVIPVVIINSFCVEYSHGKMIQLAQSALLSALGIAAAMVIAAVIFRKHPVDNFGCAFSNAGFIGIPLVQAALGDKAVFYIVAIVALMNLLQWSYGVSVITGERSAVGLRHLIINPIFASIVIGLALFLTGTGAHLPDIITSSLNGMAALNAPLSMTVLGTYLAQSDIKKMLTLGHLYFVSAVRLLIIPAVTLILFRFIPVDYALFIAVFITLSTPAGANVAVYAQLYDADYPYACQVVAITTLLLIVTLPFMIMAASLVNG